MATDDPLNFKRQRLATRSEQLDSWAGKLTRREKADWIFRGLSSVHFGLESTLDRCASTLKHRRAPITREKPWRARLESGIYRQFGRHAPLYLGAHEMPEPGDLMGWLSVMRHHDVPTRILDFSYSLPIATFFAVADGSDENDAVVVAIDAKWLDQAAKERMGAIAADAWENDKHGRRWRTFGQVFQRGLSFVHRQNAWHRNARVTAQHGVFLIPGDVEKTFEENLRAMPDWENHVRAIRIDGDKRGDLVEHLYRHGIQRSTIYPGDLSRFGAGIGDIAGVPNAIVPDDKKFRVLGQGDGPD